MTKQAEQSAPWDDDASAGGGRTAPQNTPSPSASSNPEPRHGERDLPEGLGKPDLREAIDRATAAVGQDDGKR